MPKRLRGGGLLKRLSNHSLLSVALLAALAGGIFWYTSSGAGASGTHEYRNYPYRFALTLPADFAATELPADAADTETILFQNNGTPADGGAGDGVQLEIWPYDEPQGITPAYIEQTGLAISDVAPLTFAGVPGYEATGYTFKSDNDAYGGASSDAWFVYRGSLYQLSTYARDDALLKRLLASWTFF